MKKLIAIICLFTFFIGCKHKKNSDPDPQDIHSFVLHGKHVNSEIMEFKLSDGTRCVVVEDKGVSCNWK